MGNEEERNTRNLVRSVMRLCEGAKTKVKLDSALSEDSEVKLGCTKDVFAPFLHGIVVDVVTGETVT